MNDTSHGPTSRFLSNLIARTFERHGVVEPRLPSRFEPQIIVSGTTGSATMQTSFEGNASLQPDVVVKGFTPQQDIRREAFWTAPVSVSDSPLPRSASAEMLGNSPLEPITQPFSAFEAQTDSPATPDVPMPSLASFFNLTPEPAHELPRLAFGRNTASSEESIRVESRGDTPTMAVISPATRTGILLPQTVESGEDEWRAPVDVHISNSEVALPASVILGRHSQGTTVEPRLSRLGARGTATEPLTAMRLPERDQQKAQAIPSNPEPVINVSIGRIEVRAVQARSTSNRQTAPATGSGSMSLNDYLKRGDGG